MIEKFVVTGIEIYQCFVRIYENPEGYNQSEEEELSDFCEWCFDLYIYQGNDEIEVKETRRGFRIISEDDPLGSFEKVKMVSSSKPVQLAMSFVEDYECPARFKKYLHSQNYAFRIGKPQNKKEHKPKIYHHEERTEESKKEFYRLNPHEIDHLEEDERNQLLKDSYIREAYYQAKMEEEHEGNV